MSWRGDDFGLFEEHEFGHFNTFNLENIDYRAEVKILSSA